MVCSGHLLRPHDGDNVRHLVYLTQAHCFERCVEHGAVARGWEIYFGCGDPERLYDDLQIAKPTLMIGVPHIFTRMYNKFIEMVESKNTEE